MRTSGLFQDPIAVFGETTEVLCVIKIFNLEVCTFHCLNESVTGIVSWFVQALYGFDCISST